MICTCWYFKRLLPTHVAQTKTNPRTFGTCRLCGGNQPPTHTEGWLTKSHSSTQRLQWGRRNCLFSPICVFRSASQVKNKTYTSFGKLGIAFSCSFCLCMQFSCTISHLACEQKRAASLHRRPGVYSKLHGLQNFREGLVSLEEGATMDAIVARIRCSLTGTAPSEVDTDAKAPAAEVREIWGRGRRIDRSCVVRHQS